MVAISQKAIMTQQPLFEEEPFAKSKMLNVVLLYTLVYIDATAFNFRSGRFTYPKQFSQSCQSIN